MRRGSGKIIALSCGSIAAILLAGAVQFAPILVWNASASAPVGLYRIEYRAPEIGDYVVVSPDETLETFIAGRRYLPKNIPLLKRVAALSGDEICRNGEAILINETYVAKAGNFDSLGRKLPQWSGCFMLRSDEIFLLNDHERSLDGRYFGSTKADEVIGVAKPVWVRGAS